jgi:hypothetical protein
MATKGVERLVAEVSEEDYEDQRGEGGQRGLVQLGGCGPDHMEMEPVHKFYKDGQVEAPLPPPMLAPEEVLPDPKLLSPPLSFPFPFPHDIVSASR